MSLFKRILALKNPTPPADPGEKRKITRFAVGAAFPFKALLTLPARDDEGNMITGKNRSRAWAGKLANLSETGALVHLHSSAIAGRGDPCTFSLSHGDYSLEFPGSVAHFRTQQHYASCGFTFQSDDADVQKSYRQLLEPVAIGSTLKSVEPRSISQDTAGLIKSQYQGHAGALLTIWRPDRSPAIYSFDFRMNAYGVRWSEGMTEVEPYGLSKLNLAGVKTKSPFVHLIESELDDVRWLFCLAVPNLPKAVPQDVREFLSTLVALSA